MKTHVLISLLLISLSTSAQYSIDITPIDSNIYLYTSYGDVDNYKKIDANAVVVISGNDALLFDTPWDNAQATQIIAFIQDSLKKNILLSIITHAHVDRIGSIDALHKNNIPTFGYYRTAEEAPKHGHTKPEYLFYAIDTNFRCGSLDIVAYYPGAGHTVDNIVLYVPHKKFLYGGCFIKSGYSQTIGNIADADVAAWPESVKKMQQRFTNTGIETVIPGHGSWKSANAIENTLRLLEDKKERGY
ncbi:MAG: subclass B1 metallo-beta-lactamase [Chitinophagales bacterium]|nr:subclass B1 metallo-beta-lactamase [Chitinophagaceae bacterium]MCB9064531.1 subclass B1 metallo-beta-lactamase [Chitinophagales bacterium]